MTDGFLEAQDQRNWLERLVDKIPGFKGYQNRELRRDVDKMQREHLAKQIGEIKGAARDKVRDYTDAGQIGALSQFERIDQALDGLSQRIRFADYGQSGFFDPVKIGEAELERLYAFDLAFVDVVTALGASVRSLPRAGDAGVEESAKAVLAQVTALESRWEDRANVINDIVMTGGTAS